MRTTPLNLAGTCLLLTLLSLAIFPALAGATPPCQEGSLQTQAYELLDEGLTLLQAGGYQEALPKLERALALFQQAVHPEGEADALFWLGGAHVGLFQYDRALEAYERALAIEQAIGRYRDQAILLNSIGLVFLSQGVYGDALSHYEQARAIAPLHGDPAVHMATLMGLQYTYQLMGRADSEEARAVFSEMINLPEPEASAPDVEKVDAKLAWYVYTEGLIRFSVPLPLPWADQPSPPFPPVLPPISTTVPSLRQPPIPQISVEQRLLGPGYVGSGVPGETFDEQVRLGPTLEELRAELATAQANGDLAGESRALIALGSMYQMLGQYEQALDHYQRALPTLEELGDSQGQIIVLNDIGYLYDKQDRYQEALTYYEQALALAQKAGDLAREATVRNNTGLLYKNLGRYQQALGQYEKALAIWQAIDARIEEGYTLNNLGGLYAALERYDEALARYEAALQIEREFGDGQREGRIISNIGAVYVSLGRYEAALDYFEEALAIAREIGDQAGEGTKTTNIGTVYGELQLYEQAIAQHQAALAIARELGNRVAEGTNLHSIGFWHEVQGNLADAIEYYRQSIDVFESVQGEIQVEELAAGFAGTQTGRYARLIRLLVQTGKVTEAFNYAERARARAFLDQIGNQPVDFRQGAAPELISEEQALRQQIIGLQNALNAERDKPLNQRSQELLDQLSAELEEARSDHAALLTHLKLASPEYASLVSVNTLSLEEVQGQVLDEHTTLIEYFVLDDQTLAWVINQDGFELVSLDIARDELRNQVTFLVKLIRRRDFDEQTAARLYDTLFAPLKPHIRRCNLVIVPHGVLHYLPFAALWDAERERYLIQDYALTYAPSASVLRFILEKRNADEGRLLALGNPDGSLPNAAVETQAVADLYGGTLLLGQQATESQVYNQAGQLDLLHLAAHGVYNPFNALFTRIELASDDTHDGNLEVHEVFGLDLTGANLVVLSACETALGEQSEGDELVGLTRAFLYAGSPAVVTTLWPIDDEASGALMASFYRHLRAGLTNAEALRAGQLEVLAQEKWRAPYYWAAFNLTGDSQGEAVETSAVLGTRPTVSGDLLLAVAGLSVLLILAVGALILRRWPRASTP